MTEALIQFDNKHKNGFDLTKVGITFEDYKDALKRKLEQIPKTKKVNNFSFCLTTGCVISPPYFS